jgi:hypothetical protein
MWSLKTIWQRWVERTASVAAPSSPEPDTSAHGLLRPHPDVVARRLGAELVLVHLARGTVFRLNATGQAIWDMLAAEKSAEEMIAHLQSAFGAPRATVAQDVQSLCTALVQNALLEPVPEAGC